MSICRNKYSYYIDKSSGKWATDAWICVGMSTIKNLKL